MKTFEEGTAGVALIAQVEAEHSSPDQDELACECLRACVHELHAIFGKGEYAPDDAASRAKGGRPQKLTADRLLEIVGDRQMRRCAVLRAAQEAGASLSTAKRRFKDLVLAGKLVHRCGRYHNPAAPPAAVGKGVGFRT